MQSIKTPIYQAAEIREFERIAEQKYCISPRTLMQRAGKAAFDFFLKRWPQAQKVAICCGPGNNGGDGYIFAQLAYERGIKVTIWQVGGAPSEKKPDALQALNACQNLKIPIDSLQEKSDLNRPDVIIDAICGTGLSDTLRPEYLDAVNKIQNLSLPIFSLDVPTGISSDTGKLLGKALRATATITFIGLKLGLLTGSGASYSGELVVNDLQLPTDLLSSLPAVAEKMHLSAYSHYLKPRLRDSHKGAFGHVLIIGGDKGLSGAVQMAGTAALRVGAGLVTIASHPSHAGLLNIATPELMCYGIDQEAELTPLLARANVVVLGPGLGQSAWSRKIFACLPHIEHPLVVDGDGLNLLAQQAERKDQWVLTPHPGEAGRLLGISTQEVQDNRLQAVKEIYSRYGGVSVLKGAGTLVLANHSLPALCDKGNPGMATAGMGDVLSGVIGGLLAQGIPLADAAKLGVVLHASAGDLAAKEGERGMLATDLFPYLRRLVNTSLNPLA